MRGPQRRPARTAVTSRATRSGSCGPGRPAHRPRRRSPSVPCPFLHDRGGPPIASNALRAPVRARARTASARTAAAALRCAPACAGRDSSCTVLVTISRTSEQTGASGAGNRHHHHSPARLTAAHSGSSIRTRAAGRLRGHWPAEARHGRRHGAGRRPLPRPDRRSPSGVKSTNALRCQFRRRSHQPPHRTHRAAADSVRGSPRRGCRCRPRLSQRSRAPRRRALPGCSTGASVTVSAAPRSARGPPRRPAPPPTAHASQ